MAKQSGPPMPPDCSTDPSLEHSVSFLMHNPNLLRLPVALACLGLLCFSGPEGIAEMMSGTGWWVVVLFAAVVILVAVWQWFLADLYGGWRRHLIRVAFSAVPLAVLAYLLLWAA